MVNARPLNRAAGSARSAPGRHTRDRCGGMVMFTFDEDPAGMKNTAPAG